MNLRRTMAEAGLDYEATEAAVKAGHIRSKLEASSAPAEDIEEIVKLVEDHFKLGRNKYFFVDVSHFFLFLLNKTNKTRLNYKHIFNFGKTGNNIDIKPICVAPGDNKLDPVAVNGNSLKQETGE